MNIHGSIVKQILRHTFRLQDKCCHRVFSDDEYLNRHTEWHEHTDRHNWTPRPVVNNHSWTSERTRCPKAKDNQARSKPVSSSGGEILDIIATQEMIIWTSLFKLRERWSILYLSLDGERGGGWGVGVGGCGGEGVGGISLIFAQSQLSLKSAKARPSASRLTKPNILISFWPRDYVLTQFMKLYS